MANKSANNVEFNDEATEQSSAADITTQPGDDKWSLGSPGGNRRP